eukprot:COSAG01_NODE_395_length_17610_cov_20.238764_14_plen_114_part_00
MCHKSVYPKQYCITDLPLYSWDPMNTHFNNQLLVLMSTSVSFACSWDHPLDAHFKQLVVDERKAAAEHTVSTQRSRMDTNHDGVVSQAEFNDAMGVPGEGPEESTPAAAEETA